MESWHKAFFLKSIMFKLRLPHKTAGAGLDSTDSLIPIILNQILSLTLVHHIGVNVCMLHISAELCF